MFTIKQEDRHKYLMRKIGNIICKWSILESVLIKIVLVPVVHQGIDRDKIWNILGIYLLNAFWIWVTFLRNSYFIIINYYCDLAFCG